MFFWLFCAATRCVSALLLWVQEPLLVATLVHLATGRGKIRKGQGSQTHSVIDALPTAWAAADAAVVE